MLKSTLLKYPFYIKCETCESHYCDSHKCKLFQHSCSRLFRVIGLMSLTHRLGVSPLANVPIMKFMAIFCMAVAVLKTKLCVSS